MYGYEIAKLLEELSDGKMPINSAAVYPVLRSMERQGLLRSRMVPSESGPPRKYYTVTAAGKRALSDWSSVWCKTTSFVDSVLEKCNEETTSGAGRSVSKKTRIGIEAKTRRGS